MVAYLLKSDANEGFNQIIDFLNGSSIKYAFQDDVVVLKDDKKEDKKVADAVKKAKKDETELAEVQEEHDAKKPESEVNVSPSSSAQSRKQDDKTKKEAKGKSHVESFLGYRDLYVEFQDSSDNSSNEPNNGKSSFKDASQLPDDPDMPELEDITYSDDENIVGAEADFNNLETSITTEAQARKNMIMYLKNVAGFKMDYFKGMSYDDIRPMFEAKFNSNVAFLLKTKEQIKEDENRALQKLNETPAERAAKRRKLDEEVEELKRHL
nr:hypothetical protein [Tanacetum cinerariifolium]